LIFTSSKRSTTPDLVRVGSQRLDLSLEMKKAKSITFDLFKSEGKSLTHALSDPNLGPKTIQRILDQLSSPLNDVKQKLSQLSLANAIPSKSNRASRSIASVKDVLSAIIYASILAICVAFIIIEAGILLGVAIIAGVAALFLVVTRGGNISPPQPAQ
jgi:hypothetical protein